jgi:hypothetical protein
LAPGEPPLDQLADRAGAAATLLAPVDLLQQLRFDLLGLAVRCLGLAGDLAADPAFAAGERVAAGVDLHLQAAARFLITLPPCRLCQSVRQQRNDKGLTAE